MKDNRLTGGISFLHFIKRNSESRALVLFYANARGTRATGNNIISVKAGSGNLKVKMYRATVIGDGLLLLNLLPVLGIKELQGHLFIGEDTHLVTVLGVEETSDLHFLAGAIYGAVGINGQPLTLHRHILITIRSRQIQTGQILVVVRLGINLVDGLLLLHNGTSILIGAERFYHSVVLIFGTDKQSCTGDGLATRSLTHNQTSAIRNIQVHGVQTRNITYLIIGFGGPPLYSGCIYAGLRSRKSNFLVYLLVRGGSCKINRDFHHDLSDMFLELLFQFALQDLIVRRDIQFVKSQHSTFRIDGGELDRILPAGEDSTFGHHQRNGRLRKFLDAVAQLIGLPGFRITLQTFFRPRVGLLAVFSHGFGEAQISLRTKIQISETLYQYMAEITLAGVFLLVSAIRDVFHFARPVGRIQHHEKLRFAIARTAVRLQSLGENVTAQRIRVQRTLADAVQSVATETRHDIQQVIVEELTVVTLHGKRQEVTGLGLRQHLWLLHGKGQMRHGLASRLFVQPRILLHIKRAQDGMAESLHLRFPGLRQLFLNAGYQCGSTIGGYVIGQLPARKQRPQQLPVIPAPGSQAYHLVHTLQCRLRQILFPVLLYFLLQRVIRLAAERYSHTQQAQAQKQYDKSLLFHHFHSMTYYLVIQLGLCLSLNIILNIQFPAIENGKRKLRNPVAKDNKARRVSHHEIHVDMAVSEDKIIDVRMGTEIIACEDSHAVFVLAVEDALVVLVLLAAVARPLQTEIHAPARVYRGKQFATHFIVENASQNQVSFLRSVQAVPVSHKENLSIDFRSQRFAVYDDATLFL